MAELLRIPAFILAVSGMVLYNMAAGILRAYGDSKRPLYVLICCAVINIVGDLLLVGVLHLGVAGAALATVFSQIVSVVLTFYMLRKTLHISKEEKPLWWPHFCAEHMSQMIRLGFPLALQSMLFPIANSIVQAGVNTMGTDQIAAWGICDKMNMLIWLISDSMGGTDHLCGTEPGSQKSGADPKRSQGRNSHVCRCRNTDQCGTVFFAQMLTPLFVSSQDAASLSELVGTYSRMMAPFFCFYALAEAFSGACCGTGDTIRPMITTLLAICLLRVLGILLVLPVYGTMECIVMIYIASWIAAGVSFLLLWHRDAAHISR